MFNLLHLLLVVATQITRSWCLHKQYNIHIKQHQTKYSMLKLIFSKDDSLFLEEKSWRHLGEHLKKMMPNSDLQFIHKESGNSMTTARLAPT